MFRGVDFSMMSDMASKRAEALDWIAGRLRWEDRLDELREMSDAGGLHQFGEGLGHGGREHVDVGDEVFARKEAEVDVVEV